MLRFPWKKILLTFRLQIKMSKGSESESSRPIESEDGSKHSGNSTKGQGWTLNKVLYPEGKLEKLEKTKTEPLGGSD